MHFGENQLSLRSIGISPDYPQLIRAIFNLHRSGRPQALTPASPWPWVDHAVSGLLTTTRYALFGLAFAVPAALSALGGYRQ
jgi:hypothetical protein